MRVVLCLHDEPRRAAWRSALAALGAQVVEAPADDLPRTAVRARAALVLLERRTGDGTVFDLLRRLKAADLPPLVVALLDPAEAHLGGLAAQAGADEVVLATRDPGLVPAQLTQLLDRLDLPERPAPAPSAPSRFTLPNLLAAGTPPPPAATNEVNNGLAAILAALEQADQALEADPAAARRELQGAREAARDLARLLRRVRLTAGPLGGEPRPLDPTPVVHAAARRLREALPAPVDLHAACAHDDWRIHADPEQLEDLLLGLGAALGAAAGRGTLRLHSRRLAAGATPLARREGEAVALELHLRAAPAAPPPGEPAGLAEARRIVGALGGVVETGLDPDGARVVRVVLPRTRAPLLALVPGTEPPAPTPGPPAAPAPRPRILLADDDPRVRRPLRKALEHAGYEVVEAADGEEALERHRREPDLALAVVDHRMPRLSGWEVLAELRRRAPRLPVVLVSGHSPQEIGWGKDVLRPDAFLRKPFELVDLARTVQRLLQDVPVG